MRQPRLHLRQLYASHMSVQIRYFGNFAQLGGYGLAAADYLTALRQLNIPVEIIVSAETPLHTLPTRFEPLRACVTPLEIAGNFTQLPGGATHTIIHVTPPMLEPMLRRLGPTGSSKLVAMTTWETDRFPNDLVPNLVPFDGVIVPCEWNRKALCASHVDPKRVHVVPHCYDPTWLKPSEKLRDPDGTYVFYSIGTWCERKNPLGLLKAYWTEFHDENVLLRIVAPVYSNTEAGGLSRALGRDHLPPVQYLGAAPNRLSDVELLRVHENSDCYVTLARGEGWGLGAFEAMTFGKPVIAPRYGGFLDFLDGYDGAHLVDCFETPAITPPTPSVNTIEIAGLKIKPLNLMSPDGIRGDQLWAEPDVSMCRRLMRDLYNKRADRAPVSPSVHVAQFAYREVAKQLIATLEAIV